jgi:hypothetical protein
MKSVQWGLEHEREAADVYATSFGPVSDVGVFLHSSGALAATPDHLEGDDSLLEIKCPFQHRNSTIMEALQDTKFCVGLNIYGNYSHKKKIMSITTNVRASYFSVVKAMSLFFIWLPSGSLQVDVECDDMWAEENIPLLLDFYFNRLLPEYIAKYHY